MEFSMNEPLASCDNEKHSPANLSPTPSEEQPSNDDEANDSNEQLPANNDNNDNRTENDGGSYDVIPFFYHKLPKSTDTIAQKLREEARTLFLQKRSKELLDNNELKTLWNILQKNFTQPTINGEQFLNYDDYMRIVQIAGEKYR